jgi:hypothetical protein
MPRLLLWGEKSLATVSASGGGFGPGDEAGAGVGCVWLWVSGAGGSATTRADEAAVGRGRLGLGVEGLLEDLLGDDRADLDGEFLEVGEGGAPGRAIGTPELVRGVFRRALQGEPYLIYQ